MTEPISDVGGEGGGGFAAPSFPSITSEYGCHAVRQLADSASVPEYSPVGKRLHYLKQTAIEMDEYIFSKCFWGEKNPGRILPA
jgi:hypothetical protein